MKLSRIGLMFLLLTFALFSQTTFAQTKTIIGYYCGGSYGSSGEGVQCVITGNGKFCYDVSAKTKMVGFRNRANHPSYEIGAQYRVTLKNGWASRTVFTGRMNKSTQQCEAFE